MTIKRGSGPFRIERADGTLVYLDWHGRVEWEGQRVRPDVPLPPGRENCRWWRSHPLSVEIGANLDRGLDIVRAAAHAGVPVDVAARFAGR